MKVSKKEFARIEKARKAAGLNYPKIAAAWGCTRQNVGQLWRGMRDGISVRPYRVEKAYWIVGLESKVKDGAR